MATFSAIYDEVAEKLHNSEADMITRIKEWVNLAQKDVATSAWWPWLLKEQQIVIDAAKTTGTASVTNGDETVDFTATQFSAAIESGQWYFQAGTDADWYIIDSRTDDDTIELLQPYQGTTDGTATFKIWHILYSMPSDMYAVASIRQQVSPYVLQYAPYKDIDWMDPANDQSGTNTYLYTQFGVDSSGYKQLMFFPPRITAGIYTMKYYKQVTDLSADADISIIPASDHEILIYGALVRGFEYLDDFANSQKHETNFVVRLNEMKRAYMTGPDQAIVIGRSGARPRDLLSVLELPVTSS